MDEKVAIIGIGWKGFYPQSSDLSYKELVYDAAVKAYSDANLDPRKDIDSFISVAEDFNEGTSIFDEYTPDQLGAALRPMHTIAGDGLHGLATAYMLIKTRQFNTVAVESHSKASNVLTLSNVIAYAQDPVLNRPLGWNTNFIAGLEMNRYLFDSKSNIEHCAQVVVKNRKNALRNPSAYFGANLSVDDVLSGSSISWPLSEHMISKHVDGAIVMVLSSEKAFSQSANKPVWITGVGWCNDSPSLENREWSYLPYITKAAEMAYRQAGISNPSQAFDLVEIDDTYAYKELQSMEALQLCEFGEAGNLISEGYTQENGKLPINVSGGSIGIGHLLDATGLCKALEVVLQLRGEAGQRQLKNVNTGLAQSWRGVPTTSGVVITMSN